jgi:hypothetical protein
MRLGPQLNCYPLSLVFDLFYLSGIILLIIYYKGEQYQNQPEHKYLTLFSTHLPSTRLKPSLQTRQLSSFQSEQFLNLQIPVYKL